MTSRDVTGSMHRRTQHDLFNSRLMKAYPTASKMFMHIKHAIHYVFIMVVLLHLGYL